MAKIRNLKIKTSAGVYTYSLKWSSPKFA